MRRAFIAVVHNGGHARTLKPLLQYSAILNVFHVIYMHACVHAFNFMTEQIATEIYWIVKQVTYFNVLVDDHRSTRLRWTSCI